MLNHTNYVFFLDSITFNPLFLLDFGISYFFHIILKKFFDLHAFYDNTLKVSMIIIQIDALFYEL